MRPDAWLGEGYYFWDDLEDAIIWGSNSKMRTGHYEIYISEINTENILDTVFNEEHYRFWVTQIEKAGKAIFKRTQRKATIKLLNDYFKERGMWDEVDGIRYQDIPENDDYVYVTGFYYRKRIQLVAYKLNIITSFDFHQEG